MFTKEMIDKIDKNLHDNIDIIFNFEFNGLLLLWGGAIKSLIMGLPVRDYDFILLINDLDKDNILDFINKYNLEYRVKPYCVYEIKYNGYLIDILSEKDLDNRGYNTDLVFYDIHRKQFLPFGIKNALGKRQIVINDYQGFPNKTKRLHMRKRLRDAKKFIQFMNDNNKKVKIVGNFKYGLLLFVGFLKKPIKILKIIRR